MMKRSLIRGVTAVILLFIFAAAVVGAQRYLAPYSEAATIAVGTKDYSELSARFQALAREQGGLYAFEVLERTALPEGTNLHGLAHYIAEVAYVKGGESALRECPAHFQPACGHEFARQSLGQYGLVQGIQRFADACKTIPGKEDARAECFHGLGHGLMEFLDYSFSDVLAACGQVSSMSESGVEYGQCAGGAMMEILRGGETARKYNPPQWYAARSVYLSAEEPLSFCLDAAVPEMMKETCVSLSAPWVLESSGFRFLTDEEPGLSAALRVCGSLPSSAPGLRSACFGGLGNEFTLLEGGNEISRADDYDPDALARLASRCEGAPGEDDRRACLFSTFYALSRVEGGGESLLRTFCGLSNDEALKARCL